MALIGDIQLDRTVARPGETFQVTVTPAADDVVVAIDGVRGARQYLQAPSTPGTHHVLIQAGTGREAEQRLATVTVEDVPALPVLVLEHDPYRPLAAALRVAEWALPADRAASRWSATIPSYRWDVAGTVTVTTEPLLIHDFAADVDHHLPYTPVDISVEGTDEGGAGFLVRRTVTVWSSYQMVRSTGVVQPVVPGPGLARHRSGATWSGSVEVTNVEPVEITLTSCSIEWLTADLDASMVPEAPRPVHVVLPADATTTVTTDVDRSTAPRGVDGFTAHYFGATADGTPAHVVATYEFARRRLRDMLVLDLELLTEPRLVDELTRVVRPDDGEGPRPEWLDGFVGRAVGNVIDERALWSLGALARTDGAPPAAEEASIDVGTARRILETGRLGASGEDRATRWTGTSLARALSHRWEADELVPLARDVQANISFPTNGLAPVVEELRRRDTVRLDVWAQLYERRAPDLAQLLGQPPVEGAACDPDDLPDDVPDGWACQYVGRDEQKWLPGRIVNARKGDIVLSPGGTGLIGGLLKQVNPPQRYSHCGIMTRNYYEVAHSTASDSWLEDHPNGSFLGEPAPTDGFTPAVLKYLWPGGIVQTVEEAYRGSEFTAPSCKAYRLGAFSTEGAAQFGDRWELIPAMVVKPHPQTETPEVRSTLHRIANQMRAWSVTGPDTQAGQQSALHYRFYCYSDAAIAVRPDPATGQPVGTAPADAGWAAGTLPTVCSQAIWLAARTIGQQMEGPGATTTAADLEAADVGRGAQVDDQTLDGLYLYTAEERRLAAEWLHTFLREKIARSVSQKVGDEPGALLEGLTDIADDCANQVLNTFAHDWADTEAKDSERWKDEVHPGRAVSPDNLMLYDAPNPVTGLWGYAVPLLYRTGRFEQVPVTQWRRTTGPGTLRGLVRQGGAPAPDARVNVGGTVTFTRHDGRFEVEVDEGRYKVHVTRESSYGLSEARQDVTVTFRETTDVTIDLRDPPEMFREVRFVGTADGNDDESLFEDDENMHTGVHLGPLRVGPYGTHAKTGWVKSWGGEVRAEFDFTVDWLPDNARRHRARGSALRRNEREHRRPRRDHVRALARPRRRDADEGGLRPQRRRGREHLVPAGPARLQRPRALTEGTREPVAASSLMDPSDVGRVI